MSDIHEIFPKLGVAFYGWNLFNENCKYSERVEHLITYKDITLNSFDDFYEDQITLYSLSNSEMVIYHRMRKKMENGHFLYEMIMVFYQRKLNDFWYMEHLKVKL